MKNAIAFANNDIAMIAWSYGVRPEGCMGFALYRIDLKGTETPLPAKAVFENVKPPQPTTEYCPVQKFYWKDPYARLAGDKDGNYTFRYKIVPMQGKPDALTPMTSQPILITNEVTLTSVLSPSISATFNRGLISTQHVSEMLNGVPSAKALLDHIAIPGDQLRKSLAGDSLGVLLTFLQKAKTSGKIYAALYELTDTELVAALVGIGKKLNLIVADIDKTPDGSAISIKAGKGTHTSPKQPENQTAWNELHTSASTALYRKPPSGHIVHNKFLIYVTEAGDAEAVLTGSTNWTDTGLCAQTNNIIVIEDPEVASRYLKYWEALENDEVSREKKGGQFQAPALRKFDTKGVKFSIDAKSPEESVATSYFSPNTAKQRGSKKKGELEPVDMSDLETRIMNAKRAVLFLAFIPGIPSITTFAAKAQKANKNLFVRGCLTSPDAAGNFEYTLSGTEPPKRTRVKGQRNTPAPQNPHVISAAALSANDTPAGWLPELLKAGFAIVHDKIVVIDPFSDQCVVVTGSHNLGYQASYNNDENLLIIQGNKKLAMAYATHVLDVYDHFSWRWTLGQNKNPHADAYLKTNPDQWLDWYFNAKGQITSPQLEFWLNAATQ